MEGIKYINLVEIGSVAFELWEVEIGDFSVRVNNTHVLRVTFLATWHTTVCLNNITVVKCVFIPLFWVPSHRKKHMNFCFEPQTN